MAWIRTSATASTVASLTLVIQIRPTGVTRTTSSAHVDGARQLAATPVDATRQLGATPADATRQRAATPADATRRKAGIPATAVARYPAVRPGRDLPPCPDRDP